MKRLIITWALLLAGAAHATPTLNIHLNASLEAMVGKSLNGGSAAYGAAGLLGGNVLDLTINDEPYKLSVNGAFFANLGGQSAAGLVPCLALGNTGHVCVGVVVPFQTFTWKGLIPVVSTGFTLPGFGGLPSAAPSTLK